MLSHLRFHRRAPSNPTSPTVSSWALHPESSDASPHTPADASRAPPSTPAPASSSPSSHLPPTLPPIPRVASALNEPAPVLAPLESTMSQQTSPPAALPQSEGRSVPAGQGQGFMGGAALQNYRREEALMAAAPRSISEPAVAWRPARVPESRLSRSKAPPPPINTNLPIRPSFQPAPSFVAPTELQKQQQQQQQQQQQPAGAGKGLTDKRSPGPRLASDPALLPASAPAVTSETHRPKKGLPFLKNPMTNLLMRRKTGQNAAGLQPPSFADAPQYAPIRGTKVHDFSAPRQPRRTTSIVDVMTFAAKRADPVPSENRRAAIASKPVVTSLVREIVAPAPDIAEPQTGTMKRAGRPGSGFKEKEGPPQRTSLDKPLPEEPSTAPQDPPGPTALPPVPPKDVIKRAPSSIRSASSTVSRTASASTSILLKYRASTMTAKTRTMSLQSQAPSAAGDRDSVMSALPKHMKSTSSRFSFDMIGAAKQEKLLEERHRQRELEKALEQNAAAPGAAEGAFQGQRDSRFDDLDEDGFDYDAMMEEDDLEEKIPGVNAELEEDVFEEEQPLLEQQHEKKLVLEQQSEGNAQDPDNDQENFAGFVFQRSNPASSVATPHSPGLESTPQDANGNMIGCALTEDTTPDTFTATSPLIIPEMHALLPSKVDHDTLSGLGITNGMGLESQVELQAPQNQQESQQSPRSDSAAPRNAGDDIYFNDGLADELDFEHDGFVLDESIFDLKDTDEYGQPIPGAFARAQEAMRAAQKEADSKRTSDLASRSSVTSGARQSTAHTSISADVPTPLSMKPVAEESCADSSTEEAAPGVSTTAPLLPPGITGQDLAYQSALAEATQKAAASGKFRRSFSSPPLLAAELTITSPTDSSKHSDPDLTDMASAPVSNGLDGYEDEYDDNDFCANDAGEDDIDFDDDAIIAEANAEALAHDSDGFYGQEFGFYSALPPQPHQYQYHHKSNPSSSASAHGAGSGPSPPAIALSAEKLYEYSSGGYFLPSGRDGGLGGMSRSTSGRAVSREPNLTPITERSEYSNRNSFMSMSIPMPPGSGGSIDCGVGGPRSSTSGTNALGLSSPGLVQLARMADEDYESEFGTGGSGSMSLPALMRLRSRAWGGSQASLISSSKEGSPRADRPGSVTVAGSSPGPAAVAGGAMDWQPPGSPWGAGMGGNGGGGGGASGAMTAPLPCAPGSGGHGFAPPSYSITHSNGTGGGNHMRKNSALSLWGDSDTESPSGSPKPTLRAIMPVLPGKSVNSSSMGSSILSPPLPPLPPLPEAEVNSACEESAGTNVRTGLGAIKPVMFRPVFADLTGGRRQEEEVDDPSTLNCPGHVSATPPATSPLSGSFLHEGLPPSPPQPFQRGSSNDPLSSPPHATHHRDRDLPSSQPAGQ